VARVCAPACREIRSALAVGIAAHFLPRALLSDPLVPLCPCSPCRPVLWGPRLLHSGARSGCSRGASRAPGKPLECRRRAAAQQPHHRCAAAAAAVVALPCMDGWQLVGALVPVLESSPGSTSSLDPQLPPCMSARGAAEVHRGVIEVFARGVEV
jgi:hypothetical protein